MVLEDFISSYGGKDFPLSKYRGEAAPYTTDFGIDLTTPMVLQNGQTKPLRLHFATDRGFGEKGEIYSPFNFTGSEFMEHAIFGSMIRLFFRDEFELRIMHCNKDEIEALEKLCKGLPLTVGEYIGKVGNGGLSFGKHTHTELVSIGEKSELLDSLALELGGELRPWSSEDIRKEVIRQKSKHRVERDFFSLMAWLDKEIESRKVYAMGKLFADRVDYHTGRKKRFYDSRFLFRI